MFLETKKTSKYKLHLNEDSICTLYDLLGLVDEEELSNDESWHYYKLLDQLESIIGNED